MAGPASPDATCWTAGANAQTGRDAMDILIGAYVWGSGLPGGRGPVRLRRILDLNEDRTASHLGGALRVLRTEGSLAAYATLRLGGEYRLRGLGVQSLAYHHLRWVKSEVSTSVHPYAGPAAQAPAERRGQVHQITGRLPAQPHTSSAVKWLNAPRPWARRTPRGIAGRGRVG
ncbi:hypothetical protein AB0M35_11290 [Micromonospora sp. NPDC051196]|uniref:8-oxoguanine DNA glycosylase OGG fold protein n=1 Tax=Micromonospora sp. NPDC051196 TaxID=3155281 RepID=UPI003427EF7C